MDLFIAVGIFIVVWLIGMIISVVVTVRGIRRMKALFAGVDDRPVLFRERGASGFSKKSIFTRIGGASRVLEILVTDRELCIRGIYSLFTFIGSYYDLSHRVRSENILSVRRDRRRVDLTILSEQGDRSEIVLHLQNSEHFVAAIDQIKGKAFTFESASKPEEVLPKPDAVVAEGFEMPPEEPPFPELSSQKVVLRYARGWRIFTYITVPLFWALSAFVALMPFYEGGWSGKPSEYLMVGLGVTMAVIMSGCLLAVRKGKLILLPDRLRTVGLFRNREILFSQVEGIRRISSQNGEQLIFVSNFAGVKDVSISLHYERKEELLIWANMEFTDLNVADYNEEIEDVMQDVSLGSSEEARIGALEQARFWVKGFNFLCYGIGLWAYLYPRPYGIAMTAGLLVIPAMILIAYLFRGRVIFAERNNSAYPSVGASSILISLMLTVRGVQDWQILDWTGLWMPAVVIGIVLLLAILFSGIRDIAKPSQVVIILLVVIFYSVGSSLFVNGWYDNNEPQVLTPAVVDLHEKCDHHRVEPWGPHVKPKLVDLPDPLHKQLQLGDRIEIIVHPGRFGIPWYVVGGKVE